MNRLAVFAVFMAVAGCTGARKSADGTDWCGGKCDSPNGPLGAETEVSGASYGLNPQAHSNATIAANANGQYLITYQDRRGDDTGWRAGDNLRFARLSATANLLDPGGIELDAPGPQRWDAAAASDGQDYLVAWSEAVDAMQADLRIARIGANGNVLQTSTVVRAAAKTDHFGANVCWDGAEYRLVFAGTDNGANVTTLFAARVSQSGDLIGPIASLPTTTSVTAGHPTVACAATGSLVAWTESTASSAGVQVAAWPASQAPGTASALSLPGATQVGSVKLAAGSNGFLAVWEETRGTTSGLALIGQLLGPTGARTSQADLAIAPAASASRSPQLAFDGTAFRLLTQELVSNLEQAFLTTISATSGAISENPLPITTTDRHLPSGLACAAGNCLLGWTAISSLEPYVEAARVGASNAPLDNPPLSISTPSSEQSRPAIAWDGTQLAIGWLETTGRDAEQFYIRRQRANGSWLDTEPVLMADGATQFALAALPEGGFAFAYVLPSAQPSSNDVFVAFASANGMITPVVAPLVTHTTDFLASLTCTRNECLALVGSNAYRLDHKGNSLNAPAAFACTPFLVGNEYWCASKPAATGVQIARFDEKLAPLSQPLLLDTVGEVLDQGLVLLPDANGVTLVWSSGGTPTPSEKMKVARVSTTADQILAPPADLFNSVNNGWLVPQSLVNAGGRTWLFWYANDAQTTYHLRVQELAPTFTMKGAVAELATSGLELAHASAFSTASGRMTVAYARRDSAPDRGSHRIKVRTAAAIVQNDGGMPSDGGASDGGHRDGGSKDGSMSHDGGGSDGGKMTDGGADGSIEPNSPPVTLGHAIRGCNYDTTPGTSSAIALALLIMLALLARRRA